MIIVSQYTYCSKEEKYLWRSVRGDHLCTERPGLLVLSHLLHDRVIHSLIFKTRRKYRFSEVWNDLILSNLICCCCSVAKLCQTPWEPMDCSMSGFPFLKSVTVSTVSPSICHEVMGPDAMIIVCWMLSFKPTFSLSSFTFIKRHFRSSSLSAIKVVPSEYLRLLIFLLAISIQGCASSNPAFHIMFSA